ncbi:hypothetical protein SprV_0301365700 [Sparganum proliferum]
MLGRSYCLLKDPSRCWPVLVTAGPFEVGYSRKTRLYSSVDAEATFSPLDSAAGHKRAKWARGLSSSSRRGGKKVEEAEEFPRRHTFSYEVQDDHSSPTHRAYTTQFSFSSYKPPEYSDKPLEFGTAFEFVPAEPAKEFTEDSTQPDIIPKEYKSIFTFESAFPDSHIDELEDTVRSEPNPFVYHILICLSFLLLLLFFPILAWIFIKRLSRYERIVVFRLGRRRKLKGPGFVVLLPFVDQYHLIDLDDQHVDVKPVSGGTVDEAIVEVGCRVFFRIIDPEAAISRMVKRPDEVLIRKAQSSLLSALSRVKWADLTSGHVTADVACAVRTSLNTYCGALGIQISAVNLGEVTTAKEPPPVTTALRRLNLSTLGQQIANLSPLLLSDPSTAAATAAAATAAATVGGGAGGAVSSDASAQSPVVGVGASTPQVNMLNDLIQQMVSLKHTPSVSLVGAGNMTVTEDVPNNTDVIGSSSTTKSRPAQSAGERKQLELTITSALTRAQRLLDNDAARKALGGTSLQVYIYQTDIKEESHVAAFYMDSGEGKCGKGVLGAKKPSVTVHLTSLDFADVLLGRLDLLEATKASRIRISGDILALAKLRFLLQFK